MNNERENKEVFEVLGYKLKLKKDERLEGITPSQIVDLVNTEAKNLYKEVPNLAPQQVAVLLALKFAGEKLALSKEYNETVNTLQSNTKEVLELIEAVYPSSH